MRDIYSNSAIITAINEYIHNQRDRDILMDRFVNGMTFSQLEDKYNLCERRIKKIVYQADTLLIQVMDSLGL